MLLLPASRLVAMTQVPIAELWGRANGSRPGRELTADHRGRKGASQGGCDGGSSSDGHGRALQEHDGRTGGRSIGREGEVGGAERGLVELVVVMVTVLSRSRQGSEERDFGNEWPDGRAPVCTAQPSNHRPGKSEPAPTAASDRVRVVALSHSEYPPPSQACT